jgi:TRAP-type C4-dicarboxylate transport system substrate-binding protein
MTDSISAAFARAAFLFTAVVLALAAPPVRGAGAADRRGPAAPGPSGAIVIKIGSIAPSRSPWDKALERVANDWERISNGAVRVRIYPGGIAGNEQDMIRKMRLGALQGAVFTTMGLAKIDHSLTVLCLPFLFHSREEFDAVFEQMKPSLEKTIEGHGFKVMLWTLAGWVNFFAKTPVLDPDDLKKHKISVTPDFPELEQVWKRMGYEAVPGDDSELMIQLQSGVVTALYLPALVAGSGQYFALTPHMLSPSLAPLFGGLLLSDKAWASIPAELRGPFLDAVAAAAAGLYEETMRLEADALKMMKENGLVVHDPSAETLAKWRAAADRAIAALLGTVFSREVYERTMSHILAYRKANGQ